MKQLFTWSCLLIIAIQTSGQQVRIGSSAAHPSAILDVQGSNGGLLLPRMTSAQRNAIITPAKGLLVYDTDLNAFYSFNGSIWTSAGGANGAFLLPFAASTNLVGSAFSITNTGIAIEGLSSAISSPAIRGNATAVGSYGMLGTNNNAGGFAVGGNTQSGTGVYGFSSDNGSALRAVSTSGYGLLVTGKLRFFGGNTQPKAGAVLTSTDASGNAVWKPRKIAFHLAGVYPSFQSLPANTWTKLHFHTEMFDVGGNSEPTSSASPTVGMSSFVAPVGGVYRFNFQLSIQYFINKIEALLIIQRGANFIEAAHWSSAFEPYPADGFTNNLGMEFQLTGSAETKLETGDIVFVRLKQLTKDNKAAFLTDNAKQTSLSGHLVAAD